MAPNVGSIIYVGKGKAHRGCDYYTDDFLDEKVFGHTAIIQSESCVMHAKTNSSEL
jgi:hypothetical protein